MKAYLYPSDTYGCGHFRVIWPAQALQAAGHDVTVVGLADRDVKLKIVDGVPVDVTIPPDADVIVFQRITHRLLMQAVPLIRRRGVAVVVDVDDDLTAIHPDNPAWRQLYPKNEGQRYTDGKVHQHSWHHLSDACRDATLVTVSTPALARRYAPHGRVRLLRNCLPDGYFKQRRRDSAIVGWPASLHSHPNDPDVVGPAVARLVHEGVDFRVVGDARDAGHAFRLDDDPASAGSVTLEDWPAAVAKLGIGITPLADTKFNQAKSWLKPLELAACGVPWIGSPRTEYVALQRQGCGLLAETPKDWYRKIGRLVHNHELRAELSDAGREVAERWKLRDHAWRWWEAWEDAVALERGDQAQPPRDRVVVDAKPVKTPTTRVSPFGFPRTLRPA